MTARRPTARERIVDWNVAYHVMLEEMNTTVGPGSHFDLIAQDRRTAALAAAILVSTAGVERAVAVAEDVDR